MPYLECSNERLNIPTVTGWGPPLRPYNLLKIWYKNTMQDHNVFAKINMAWEPGGGGEFTYQWKIIINKTGWGPQICTGPERGWGIEKSNWALGRSSNKKSGYGLNTNPPSNLKKRSVDSCTNATSCCQSNKYMTMSDPSTSHVILMIDTYSMSSLCIFWRIVINLNKYIQNHTFKSLFEYFMSSLLFWWMVNNGLQHRDHT